MEIRGYITHLFLQTYLNHAGTFKLSLSSRTAGRMVQVASDSITLPTDLARRSMAQNSELEGRPLEWGLSILSIDDILLLFLSIYLGTQIQTNHFEPKLLCNPVYKQRLRFTLSNSDPATD